MADLADNLRGLRAVIEVKIARRRMTILAPAFFRRCRRSGSSPHDGNALSEFMFVFFLKLLPIWGVRFWLRRLYKRKSRINPELTIMRGAILSRFKIYIFTRATEYFLKNRNDRGQIIIC